MQNGGYLGALESVARTVGNEVALVTLVVVSKYWPLPRQ